MVRIWKSAYLVNCEYMLIVFQKITVITLFAWTITKNSNKSVLREKQKRSNNEKTWIDRWWKHYSVHQALFQLKTCWDIVKVHILSNMGKCWRNLRKKCYNFVKTIHLISEFEYCLRTAMILIISFVANFY